MYAMSLRKLRLSQNPHKDAKVHKDLLDLLDLLDQLDLLALQVLQVVREVQAHLEAQVTPEALQMMAESASMDQVGALISEVTEELASMDPAETSASAEEGDNK
jgi:hypothetical protein